jgi:hypothetical protein
MATGGWPSIGSRAIQRLPEDFGVFPINVRKSRQVADSDRGKTSTSKLRLDPPERLICQLYQPLETTGIAKKEKKKKERKKKKEE